MNGDKKAIEYASAVEKEEHSYLKTYRAYKAGYTEGATSGKVIWHILLMVMGWCLISTILIIIQVFFKVKIFVN
jgi:hypothetical protein